MNLTEKEIALLVKLARDEYNTSNTAEPTEWGHVSGGVWAFSVLESESDGGVFASLEKKGLVIFNDYGDKNENTVAFTREGFAAYRALPADVR